MNQCPFLSSFEEKILCFKECAFFELEESQEGCPFKKTKGIKIINIKEMLSFDIEKNSDEDYFQEQYLKQYV